jgi:nucleoside-triphosphatase THEP1
MNLSVHDRAASTSTRKPTVILLSGKSGNGKTTLCTQVVASLKSKGLNIAGLITWPRFSSDEKVGMEAESIRTGEQRTLAERDAPIAGRITRHWRFR